MERNTVTTVGELTIGCRFHFLKDAKKTVWEVKGYANKKVNCDNGQQLHPTPFHKNMQVVFLRNANDPE
jgi:chemotaxis methyl-accepting protein methylase